ncbi:ATP-binding protein [Bacillus cereus group sp. MG9]
MNSEEPCPAAISKRIIELHNGNITVDSKLDRGTIFTISLPKNTS